MRWVKHRIAGDAETPSSGGWAKQASPNQGGSKLPHSKAAFWSAQACLRLVSRQLAAAPPKSESLLTAPADSRLELVPQTQLDLARRTGRLDDPKIAGARKRSSGRQVKIGMVQEVEELRPKIQLVPFSKNRSFRQEQVDNLQSRSLSRIPSQRAVGVLALDLQAADVEPATRITLRGRQLIVHARNGVGRLKSAEPVVGLVITRPNGKRKTRGKRRDPAYLPSLEELADKPGIEPGLAQPHRKIIEHAGDKALALVETRSSSIAPDDIIL